MPDFQNIPSITITSWNHFNDVIFDGSWKGDIERYRSNYVYRGLSCSSYDLKTSLIRLGGSYELLEKHLIRNFRKYAHRDVPPDASVWNWLSLAQHHGLPTRLLDWTYSPYVALHFATSNLAEYEQDGVIWCVDYVSAHDRLPDSLHGLLEIEGCNAFTTQLLGEGADTLERFENMSKEPFVVFFEPPSLDDRIVNQYALHSVISSPTMVLNEWLETQSVDCRRVIIPKEVKWELRDKLDQANITERVLFPGLGGLCDWLARHYSPKN